MIASFKLKKEKIIDLKYIIYQIKDFKYFVYILENVIIFK